MATFDYPTLPPNLTPGGSSTTTSTTKSSPMGEHTYNPGSSGKSNITFTINSDGQLVGTGPDNTNVYAYLNELGGAISYGDAEDGLINYYNSTGKMPMLLRKLSILAGKQVQLGDVIWRGFINSAITQLSAYNYQQTRYDGTGKSKTLLGWIDYLTKSGKGTGGGAPTQEVIQTERNTAWDIFKNTSLQLTNKVPSKKDFEDFYSKLLSKEKKYISKVSVSGNTRYNTRAEFNVANFTLKYLVDRVDFNNKDLNGTAKTYLNKVEQLMRDNGVDNSFSHSTKIKYVKNLLEQQMSIDDIANSVRKQAMATYTAWAKDMQDNPDLNFSDLISPYSNIYKNTLEVNTPINVSEVANMATDGTNKLSTNDFISKLRMDSRWEKTAQARSEMNNLIVSFARGFGVNI